MVLIFLCIRLRRHISFLFIVQTKGFPKTQYVVDQKMGLKSLNMVVIVTKVRVNNRLNKLPVSLIVVYRSAFE